MPGREVTSFFQGDFYRDDKLKHPWDSLIPVFQSLGEYFGVDCPCLVEYIAQRKIFFAFGFHRD